MKFLKKCGIVAVFFLAFVISLAGCVYRNTTENVLPPTPSMPTGVEVDVAYFSIEIIEGTEEHEGLRIIKITNTSEKTFIDILFDVSFINIFGVTIHTEQIGIYMILTPGAYEFWYFGFEDWEESYELAKNTQTVIITKATEGLTFGEDPGFPGFPEFPGDDWDFDFPTF
ncbi:MAG: hypothetical protein FWD89_01500 [Firmicutes bacterium]|nr:hypothetical protein [Bacillota bacterium]MCL2770967.1 hypothetical protein [Bacillota bacterium]